MAEHIDTFSVRRVATTGHEILDPDGTVIAWAATEAWAALIAGLLNRVEADAGSAVCGRSGSVEDIDHLANDQVVNYRQHT